MRINIHNGSKPLDYPQKKQRGHFRFPKRSSKKQNHHASCSVKEDGLNQYGKGRRSYDRNDSNNRRF